MSMPSLTGRPDPNRPTQPVTSAGGVILDAQKRVLVLRRRQEGTWVLPKGRMEKGESLWQTATREVEEETGLKGLRVVRELGLVRYVFYWKPDNVNYRKTVHYFLMKLDSGIPALKLEEDFSDHAWLAPEEAARTLTFENDRRIVRSICN